jgi:AAA domain
MAHGVEGVASVSQLHSLKDIKALLDTASDDAVAEFDKRLEQRKAKQPANDNKPKTLQVPDQVRATQKERFQITWFDDVDKTVTKDELVEGVLGAGEFSLFVAKPGMGKSVLAGDIGMHIAAGMDWHGRPVKRGLVVFFAAERKKITERRVAAWGKKHGVANIPFVVVGGKLDLTTGLIDAKALATTIKKLEEKSGKECVLIILDTVTRTFGPGDQHQSRDMQRYVQSVDELNRATTAHIAAIHHSPWSDDRGKGAIDLDGAIDVSFVVNVVGTGPAKVFTLKCTGANDGQEGDVTSFRLESVELGTDGDGNVTTAPVVVQVDAVTPFDVSKLKGNSAKAFDSLERAIEANGECVPDGSPGFPDGVCTVSRDEWRDQFYADTKAKTPAILDPALRQRFTRAIGELLNGEKIIAVGERVWIA